MATTAMKVSPTQSCQRMLRHAAKQRLAPHVSSFQSHFWAQQEKMRFSTLLRVKEGTSPSPADNTFNAMDRTILEVQNWLHILEETHWRQRKTFLEEADILVPSQTSAKMQVLFEAASFQNDQMVKRVRNIKGVLRTQSKGEN